MPRSDTLFASTNHPHLPRKDKLNKKGFASIQITICWAGHCVRVSSGERCRPEHRGEEDSRVRAVKDSYYAQTNPELDDVSNAAERALDQAQQERRQLSEAKLLAAVEAVVKPHKPAPVRLANPAAPAPQTVLQGLGAWVQEQGAKVAKQTGKATSPNTINAYNATRQRLADF